MARKKVLGIDVETYSDEDIAVTGAYRYCLSPNFTILLFAYAFNDEEVQIVDFANGEKLPNEVFEALTNPDIIKSAFNANFERNALKNYFKLDMYPEQWRCTMIQALRLGLPGSLAMVGKALKFPEDKQKMQEGKSLIKLFCAPKKVKKNENQITFLKEEYPDRNMPDSYPDKWKTFKDYCIQDVVVEREIRKRLEIYPTTEKEHKLWSLDQLINDRGVLTDIDLINSAIEIDGLNIQKLTEEAIELTRLDNPNSPTQLKKWLSSRVGYEVDKLTKDSIVDLYKSTDNEEVKRVLKLRTMMAKTSVKKYEAMLKSRCKDGRVRGLLQFYGASRTGRWAGRLVQVQNLPQNHLTDLDEARTLVKTGDLDSIEFLYDSVSDTLSQLIRTAFIPSPGHRFIVADFSAIEARVIAWIANEEWRLEVFKNNGDIYCASAEKMFHIPVKKHGVNGHLRQKGKIAELACIAEGELVLTDKGLIPIEKITLNHRVWDGLEWVTHDGVICNGEKEVITYGGLTATKDHVVWVRGRNEPIQFEEAAKCGAHLLQSGHSGKPIRVGENNISQKTMVKKLESFIRTSSMSRVWRNKVDMLRQFKEREDKRMSKMFTTKKSTEMVRQKIYCSKAKMHKSKRQKLQELWCKRNRISIPISIRSLFMDDRNQWNSGSEYGARQNRRKWTLRKRKSKVGYSSSKLSESKKVYDIINCGKRNRYTVSNVLVHNCGYGGSVGALKAMDRKGDIPEEDYKSIIDDWRNANTNITTFWWDCDKAAKKAIMERTTVELQYGLKFIYAPGVLFIELPSRRRLSYIRPKIEAHQTFSGTKITYEGMDQTTKQWTRLDTYGPKLVENIVQGIARDCLGEAMFGITEAGYEIVFHVHDELILDVPKNFGSLEEVNSIFGRPISWAPGLLLNADGYECDYYKKD